MQGRTKIVTGPDVEPVTVEQVKLHTRIDEDVEDSIISLWISAARKIAEDYQRRAYITQTRQLILDHFPRGAIILPGSPIQAVSSFKYYDLENTETSWDLSNLLIDTDTEPGRLITAYGINYPVVTLRDLNAVIIEYTAGYGDTAADVPENIKDAILLYCAYRYENRVAEVASVPDHFYDVLRPDRVYDTIK